MVKIKNVATKDLKMDGIVAGLKKAYPFLKLSKEDEKTIVELTPDYTKKFTFEILEANTALAIGWRRIMLDELIYPRLTCSMDDIKSDDQFCQRMTDYIQNRIWLIPTSYIPESDVKLEFTLDVKNTTSQPMIVKSSKIIPSKHNKIKLEFSKENDVIELQPGRFIKITMTLEWGINRNHGSFSKFHGMIYKPLGYGDLNQETLPASVTQHPSDYLLGMHCLEFIDPLKDGCLPAWRTMRSKLESAAKKIQDFCDQKEIIPYITTELTVTSVKGNRVRYEFFRETYTLSNLIAWYAYKADPSVVHLLAGDDHPEDDSCLVKIIHKDHAGLLIKACQTAIKDIDAIIKQF